MTNLTQILNDPRGRELVESIEELEGKLMQCEPGSEEWTMLFKMRSAEEQDLLEEFGFMWFNFKHHNLDEQ